MHIRHSAFESCTLSYVYMTCKIYVCVFFLFAEPLRIPTWLSHTCNAKIEGIIKQGFDISSILQQKMAILDAVRTVHAWMRARTSYRSKSCRLDIIAGGGIRLEIY